MSRRQRVVSFPGLLSASRKMCTYVWEALADQGLEDGKRSLTGEVIATGMELSLPSPQFQASELLAGSFADCLNAEA